MKYYLTLLLFNFSIFLFSQKEIEINYFVKLSYSTNTDIAYKKALDTLQYKNISQEIEFDAKHYLSIRYNFKGDYIQSKKYLDQLKPINITQQYYLYQAKTIIEFYKGNKLAALQYILKSKEIIHNKYYDPEFIPDYFLSIFYLEYKNYDKVNDIANSYLEILKKKNIKTHFFKFHFFSKLAESYTYQKKYQKALQNIDSAIYHSNYHKDTLALFHSKRLKSFIYIEKKEYDKAEKIAFELDSPPYSNNDRLNVHFYYRALNYYNLGRIYYEKKEYNKAEHYLEKSYTSILTYPYHEFYHSSIQMYSNLLAKKKEYKKAYELLNKMVQKKDSINNYSFLNKILKSELNHVEEIEKVNYRTRQTRWYWILSIISILLIFSIILYSFRLNNIKVLKSKNDLIKEKNSQLEKLNSSLEKFTQIASHDLKAPIRTIGHLTTFIIEDEPNISKESKENLKYVLLAVERSNNLIINLLALAKSNDTSISMEKVEVLTLLNTVKSNLFQLISDSNAFISYESNNTLINGNKSLLTQLIQNIIENSIQYARKDCKPVIEISTFEDEKNTTLYIKDNGIGIKTEKEPNLFNSFSQEKFESLNKGVGLGLYIAKKIADIHNAKISIKNNVNDFGSTITITFNKE